MQQAIAEQLEQRTGAIIGARTVRGTAAPCRLVGNEITIGEHLALRHSKICGSWRQQRQRGH
jgi:hypothetical protein